MKKCLTIIVCLALAGCGGHVDGGSGATSEAALAGPTRRAITLKTAVRGTYVVAENGGGGVVNANREVASTWETFTLHDLDGGDLVSGDLVWLAALNGQFVVAEEGGGGAVNANRVTPLDWETFRIVKLGGSAGAAIRDGDQIALQTKTRGLFVCALEGGGGALVADRMVPLGWETFVVGSPGVAPPPGWKLTFSDEFDGAAGPIDRTKWAFDVGGHGWATTSSSTTPIAPTT
jgi:hypothetical protein